MPTHEMQVRTSEAIAINAILCRLEQVGRKRFGLIEVDAKHVIELALAKVTSDEKSMAYQEVAETDTPAQKENETLIDAAKVFNRAPEKAAA